MNCNYNTIGECTLYETPCETTDCHYKKKERLADFQQSLRDGLTIEEACNKYQLTLKYVMNNISNSLKKPTVPRDPKMQYIVKQNKRFKISKSLNSTTVSFGTYRTLEDATKVRDHFVKYGWDKSKLDDYCKAVGVERVISKRGRY